MFRQALHLPFSHFVSTAGESFCVLGLEQFVSSLLQPFSVHVWAARGDPLTSVLTSRQALRSLGSNCFVLNWAVIFVSSSLEQLSLVSSSWQPSSVHVWASRSEPVALFGCFHKLCVLLAASFLCPRLDDLFCVLGLEQFVSSLWQTFYVHVWAAKGDPSTLTSVLTSGQALRSLGSHFLTGQSYLCHLNNNLFFHLGRHFLSTSFCHRWPLTSVLTSR